MPLRAAVLCACLALGPSPAGVGVSAAAPQGAQVDPVTRLVLAIEYAIRTGDDDALRALARHDINRARLADFVQTMTSVKVAQVTLKERDRAALENGGQRLLLEILTVQRDEGRVSTWRIDAAAALPGDPWMIAGVERLTVINGLYRLALDTSVEWDVRNAVVTAPDLRLTLPSGFAFAVRTPDGTTGLILVGRGRVDFTPKADSERGQIRMLAGSEALKTDFDTLFVRMNPGEFSARVSEQALTPRAAADPGHARRAAQVFDAFIGRSYLIDLNDLSTARWSLVPSYGDFVAEIVTGRHGPLTYARAGGEPEDISLFDRRRRRNIAVYTSDQKMATRGRFFSEDERLDYDITRYEVDATFAPERMWVDGVARLSIRTRANYLATVTVRLADPLVVRSITSPQFGRLLHLRVVGQNNVLVGFPGTVPGNTEFDLVITYGGRLLPPGIDREAAGVEQDSPGSQQAQEISIPAEPQWTYSNRSYWYPQAPVTDYAPAKLTLSVPDEFDVIASGTQQGAPALLPGPPGQRGRKRFVFESAQPLRYLAVLISRFQAAPPVRLNLTDDGDPLTLQVEANPRQASRIRQHAEKASEILKFYGSLMNDAPYDSFTLALTESDLPGGHSPAYFAMLNQPLPTSPYTWTNDPVSFPNYSSFFIAHEIAHQWWGQGVGWKNYHEQWLSEGFAQYFAALYAEKERGPDQFASVMRQMRRWAMEMSPQGPVYLGYRLGHIRGESRVFRALVYNKGAMVLHMLRRLIGDGAFFGGLRQFYATWLYAKAGTDDFRVAMEKAAGGGSLERFFERWIYTSGIPAVRFTSTVEGSVLTARFEQKGEIFDVPITVTVNYADGTSEDVVVTVTDRTAERKIELKRALRNVDVNKDSGALVEIEK